VTKDKMSFSLIGPGRVGQSIARRLLEAGYVAEAVVGRKQEYAADAALFIGAAGRESTDIADAGESDLVLLAVPDDVLRTVGGRLLSGKNVRPDSVLIHFSGIHCADVLTADVSGSPNDALSIHPLQSFADRQRGYEALAGTPFAIEGSPNLLPLAERIVKDLKGIPFPLASEHKALYHAAACVTSNYLATLIASAEKMLASCDFSADEARRLLGPMLQTTARNIAEIGPAEALTGPIARGDAQTVARHLQGLDGQKKPAEAELYRFLGRLTIDVGMKKGTLSGPESEKLRKLLE